MKILLFATSCIISLHTLGCMLIAQVPELAKQADAVLDVIDIKEDSDNDGESKDQNSGGNSGFGGLFPSKIVDPVLVPQIKPEPVDRRSFEEMSKLITLTSGEQASLLEKVGENQAAKSFLDFLGPFPYSHPGQSSEWILHKLWGPYCENPLKFEETFRLDPMILLPELRPDPEANGPSVGAGDPVTTRITYKGVSIPVIYYNTIGGSRLTFVPPVDFARNANGTLMCFAMDPDTLEEIDLDHDLPNDKKVELNIDLDFFNSDELRRYVWTARDSIREKVEGIVNEESQQARRIIPAQSISIAHFTSIKIQCTHPKYQDVLFELDSNPSVNSSERFFAEVPWSFVKRLCSRGGLSFKITYYFPISKRVINQVSREDVIQNIDRTLLDQSGESFLRKKSSDDENKVQILVDRKKFAASFSRQLFSGSLVIEGDSAKLIDVLRHELRSMVNARSRVQDSKVLRDYYKATYDWARELERPSLVNAMQKIGAEQELTASERKDVEAAMKSTAKNIQAGGQFGFTKGLLSIAGGGGGGKSWANDDFDFDNVSQQDLRDFQKFHTEFLDGTFVVPPALDLTLIAEQDLKTVIPNRVMMISPTKVQESFISATFTSGKPLFPVEVEPIPTSREGSIGLPEIHEPNVHGTLGKVRSQSGVGR